MTQGLEDRAPNLDKLVQTMEACGFRFLRFDISCEDPCLPVDVEWNYKDLVHVGHVHWHMSRQFFYTGQNIYTTIDLQKFFGITLPQSGVFYVTDDNRIVVHTTLFFYVIFVEIRSELVGDLTTRTSTNYAVGTRSRLLGLLTPLIRFGMRRNWARFTADDRPLRWRRGALRKAGFSFSDTSPIDHRATLDVSDRGVTPPAGSPADHTEKFVIADHLGKTELVGEADHLGLQIHFDHDKIRLFPRLCPHRGAALDTEGTPGPAVVCPWHGRHFRALVEIAHDRSPQSFQGPLHHCDYDGENLVIRTRADVPVTADTDWTTGWVPLSEPAAAS